jgi:hypothetical protein
VIGGNRVVHQGNIGRVMRGHFPAQLFTSCSEFQFPRITMYGTGTPSSSCTNCPSDLLP